MGADNGVTDTAYHYLQCVAEKKTGVPVWLNFVVNPVPNQSECFLSIQKLSKSVGRM